MSVFTDIATKVEAFAAAAVAEGEKDFAKLVEVVVDGAEATLEAAEPIVETDLTNLTNQLGAVASDIVNSLFGAAGTDLTGDAKANLAETSLVDVAIQKGIALADSDASTLIKNAFTAVEAELKAISAKAAAIAGS